MRGAAPIGLAGFVLLLALSWATGTDFVSMVGGGGGAAPATDPPGELRTTPEEERLADFVDVVAGDVQDTWSQLLGDRYRPSRVVLFRDTYQPESGGGCGFAQAATGPFYCPSDGKVYLDLGFFSELSRKLGAPGEFARASHGDRPGRFRRLYLSRLQFRRHSGVAFVPRGKRICG